MNYYKSNLDDLQKSIHAQMELLTLQEKYVATLEENIKGGDENEEMAFQDGGCLGCYRPFPVRCLRRASSLRILCDPDRCRHRKNSIRRQRKSGELDCQHHEDHDGGGGAGALRLKYRLRDSPGGDGYRRLLGLSETG